MGMVRFLLPARVNEDLRRELEHACMAGGPDNMPWPTEVRVDAKHLTLRRSVDESGALVVPWDVFGSGRLMGTTATLMERPEPYHLAVELARGKVNQLRCQAEEWRAGGLQTSPLLEELIREAGMAFARAATEPAMDQAGQQAQAALAAAYMAADELVKAYMDQVFQIRRQRQPVLATALGCRLYT